MYKPILIEAVYPDGTIMVRNRFVMENAACKGEDPKMTRSRLYDIVNKTMARWNESYGHNSSAKLRISVNGGTN